MEQTYFMRCVLQGKAQGKAAVRLHKYHLMCLDEEMADPLTDVFLEMVRNCL